MNSPARTAWLALLVAATLAYYFWTAMCSFDDWPRLRPAGIPETDHFNLLSHGFRKGQLHLDGEVPPALLAAPNPYDPKTRPHVAVLHDASFYRGKYYIYFGPAPVVTLLLPFSVLTGRDLPLPYAVWLYCSIGFLALTAVLLGAQRRHFPAASTWTVTAALLALGGGGMLVALLRRPHIWEVSGSAGFCFFALSLLCLFRALHSPRAVAWAAAGGLALGLAVGSRPTYLVASAMFAAPLLWRRVAHYDWRALLAAAAGCSAIVVALLAYNYARFENPFEFGQKYQLSAIIEGDARHFSLSYIWFNFRIYFLAPLRWTGVFPFHDGIALPPLPAGHGGYEYTVGLFSNLPFSLLALAPCFLLRRDGDAPRLALFAAIAAATAGQALVHLCYFGQCIRYLADFAPGVMLLAGGGLFLLEERLSRRAWLRGAGLALAGVSAAAAALAVVPLYNSPPPSPPAAYRPVARVLNAPAFWLQHRAWPEFSPVELTLSLPADRRPRVETLARLVRDGQTRAQVDLEYLDASRVRFTYREPASSAPLPSPAIAATGAARHVFRLSLGGDYADFDGARGRLRAQFDSQPLWHLPAVSLSAYPGKLLVGRDAGFTGEVHGVRPIAVADFARPGLGGVRLRFTPTAALLGRWLPLATSGRPNAADFLALRVEADGRTSIGYDHWGEPMHAGPKLPLALDRDYTLEFWLPAVHPAREVVVKLDGAEIWRQPAPHFDTTPESFFIALNPVGGSTSEPALENAIVEATQLPPPQR